MGTCKRQQVPKMERMAAMRGPASWPPKWIQFLRPSATGPDGVLGGVGTQLQDRMIQEANQPIPQHQGIVAGFDCCAHIRYPLNLVAE